MLNADIAMTRVGAGQNTTGGTDLLALGQKRMAWLQTRQQVLASNVANADTPDYTPRDVTPFQPSLNADDITPVRTNPAHIGDGDGSAETMTRPSPERALDGNRVSLEHEMEQIADVSDQQHLVVNLYGKYMNMFQTALGK